MGKIQNTNNTKYWQGCEAKGNFTHHWWDCKTVQPLGKAVWWFLTKFSILSPCDAAVWLLDIYPQETTTLPRRNVPEDVCVSFVHNCKNMEATTPPFSG